MGKRGRRPTPTNILKLRGSWRGKLNRGEPQPDKGPPERPTWLADDAAAVWDELIPQLDELGILTRIDGNALARYCTYWVRWQQTETFLRQYGLTYPIKDSFGAVRQFCPWPQVAINHKLAADLARLEAEFGLTPSARSRITVAPRELERPGKARFFG